MFESSQFIHHFNPAISFAVSAERASTQLFVAIKRAL